MLVFPLTTMNEMPGNITLIFKLSEETNQVPANRCDYNDYTIYLES